MKIFLRPFFRFHLFKMSSCQFIMNECTLSTGKLPLGCMPRNSVVRIIDSPDMTSAVYHGHKALNKKKKKTKTNCCHRPNSAL